MADAALIAAAVTVVSIVVTWVCRRLGAFGRQVLDHLSTVARLPAAVTELGEQLREALEEWRHDREDFATRLGRLEQHTGVITP